MTKSDKKAIIILIIIIGGFMRNFFAEFKKFITRGNVVDMAVGVIVGSSFTAIVNGLSNFILKPVINWLLALVLGADTLSELFTMLKPAYMLDETGKKVIDLANSIYIDWGSFINAIINFFLVALVLFVIVKAINKFREDNKGLRERVCKGRLSREQKNELRANQIKPRNKNAVKAYFEEKERLQREADEAAAALEAQRVADEREANPTVEDILREIRDILKKA